MVVEPFRFQGWIDLKNRHFATLKAFNHQLNLQLRAGTPAHPMPVRPASTPEPGGGAKPVGTGQFGLAGARLQYRQPSPENSASALALPTQEGALDLLVDSTGIKFLGEGEWKRRTHGAEYRRQWRKVHLAIDAQTLEIRAIEVTDNTVGDPLMLPELLAQIPADEVIGSVSADGAYDTQGCHDAIAQRGPTR
jgi:hypothetical protein